MTIPYNQLMKPPLGSFIDPAHSLAKGLVVYHLQNEKGGLSVRDLSSNRNIGTLTNSPSWQQDRFGLTLWFSGTAYVEVVDSSSFDQLANEMTLSVWVRPQVSSAGSSAFKVIFDKSTGNSNAFRLMLTDTGNIRFRTPEHSDPNLDSSGFSWAANELFHLVVTWDGATKAIYINGILNISEPAVGTLTIDTSELRIGGDRLGNAVNFFDGGIDLPMIYNRVLSVSQVADLCHEPFAMFNRDLLELWPAAFLASPAAGLAGIYYRTLLQGVA